MAMLDIRLGQEQYIVVKNHHEFIQTILHSKSLNTFITRNFEIQPKYINGSGDHDDFTSATKSVSDKVQYKIITAKIASICHGYFREWRMMQSTDNNPYGSLNQVS